MQPRSWFVVSALAAQLAAAASAAPPLHQWMAKVPAYVYLDEVVIPGTHDSGTWTFSKASSISVYGDQPRAALLLNLRAEGAVDESRGAVARWARTQRLDAAAQLRAGARYFDLRIELKGTGTADPPDGQLYLVHGMYGPTLETFLQAVANFLAGAPSEVVLLDLQAMMASRRLEGSKDFRDLEAGTKGLEGDPVPAREATFRAISRILGPRLVPPMGARPPLMGALRGKVIVLAPDGATGPSTPYLWPRSRFLETRYDQDAMSSEATLVPFLEAGLRAPPGPLRVTQWLITPTEETMKQAEANRALRPAIDEAEQRLKDAQQVLAQATAVADAAASTLAALEGPTGDGVRAAQVAVEETSKSFEAAKASVGVAQGAVRVAQAAVEADQAALDGERRAVDAAEAGLRRAQSSLRGAEKTWSDFTGAFAQAARWAAAAIGQGDKWDQLERSLNNTRNQKSAAQRALDAARGRQAARQANLNDARTALKKAQDDLRAAQQQVEASRKAYLSAKDTLGALPGKLASARKAAQEGGDAVRAAQANVDSKQRDLKQLKARLHHVPPSLVALADGLNRGLAGFTDRHLGSGKLNLVIADAFTPALGAMLVERSLRCPAMLRPDPAAPPPPPPPPVEMDPGALLRPPGAFERQYRETLPLGGF